MKLHRFNEVGIQRFGDFLTALAADPGMQVPVQLLEDPDCTELAIPELGIEHRVFSTRLDAAKYLDSILVAGQVGSAENDVGLWTWISLFYFDQLCPADEGGKRLVGERARYVPQVGISRRYYRHLLVGPWLMLRPHRDNPDRLLALLSSPLDVGTSETYRLFIENPSLISCKAVADAATWLYFDKHRGKLKRGSGSKDAGGCRRLIQFLQQIDCTFDLPILAAEKLRLMLPPEFNAFIPKQLNLIE